MLESSYRRQAQEYHSVAGEIIALLSSYHGDSQSESEDINAPVPLLPEIAGIRGMNLRIVPDSTALNAYRDSILAGGGLLAGVDLEGRVIETSVAKTANGQMLIVEAIEHNNKQIKNLEDISIALIIILITMVIIAIVPGVLMIESMARRRRMAGSVLSSSGSSGWENSIGVFDGSEYIGCMVVSPANVILWTNGTCREMLEIGERVRGVSLASVTSLPDRIRLEKEQSQQSPCREAIRVTGMRGNEQRLCMEILPVVSREALLYRIFLFTRPPEEDSVQSGSGISKLGGSLETGSPAGARLAESIIHDMNNQLSGIIGSASLELDIMQNSSDSREVWSAVLTSAEKMTRLCSDLQALFTDDDDPVVRDIAEEMNQISQVMGRILPEEVRFQVTGGSDKLVSVKREHMRELIYNLSLNSMEMMNGEGRIRIDISERVPQGISKMESIPPGSRVCIRYSDGYIMPVAIRDALSSRNYSVSDVERQFGTAVGALYKVLRDIEGNIVFERGSGETVLCIILEGLDRSSPAGRGESTEQFDMSSVTGLSVLVAEEVEIILQSSCEYLEHRGMVTTAASNGDRAMELLRTRKFDAAVLDLNMPGIPTASIVRYCQTSLPSMAVIITTGYGMSGPVRDLLKATSTDCLYKPHRPEVLVETIYSTLMRIQEGENS